MLIYYSIEIMEAFNLFKEKFTALCKYWKVPTPKLEESYDFQNHTGPDSIAVHITEVESVDLYVTHIFGHYLADLHNSDPKMSDKVANLIANWCVPKNSDLFLA